VLREEAASGFTLKLSAFECGGTPFFIGSAMSVPDRKADENSHDSGTLGMCMAEILLAVLKSIAHVFILA
jgi:hypothetical protein